MTKKEVRRLHAAVMDAREALEQFRKQRQEMIRQFVGRHYGENGASDRVPLNFLNLATEIYLQNLASDNPRTMISSPHQRLKPAAEKLEIAVNQQIDKMALLDTMRDVVLDALFCVGAVKIGISEGEEASIDGVTHVPGEPFVDPVDLDNLIFDVNAASMRSVQFMGNSYRMPRDVILDSALFDKKDKDKLIAVERNEYKKFGVEGLDRPDDGRRIEGFEDEVALIDVWLPRQGLLLTFHDGEEQWDQPLRSLQWLEPANGPYHLLRFYPIPSNVMPASPMSMLLDLHELANQLFCKAARQAKRQKTISLVRRGADADGNRIWKAEDGDVMGVDDASNVNEMSFGGANPGTIAFLSQIQPLVSYLGGNLDALGGLGPQSGTLGQDQLLSSNASQRIRHLQGRVLEFTRDVVRDLSYHLYHDPFRDIHLVKRLKGPIPIEVPFIYSPEDRTHDFFRFNFEIDPHSMQSLSPSQKAAALLQIFNGVIAPMLPILRQNGMSFDFEALIRKIGKYVGIESDLSDLMLYTDPASYKTGAAGGERQIQSPVTHRIQERINRPGAIRDQQSNVMAQFMLGGRPQESELASAFRRTG